MSFRSSKLTDPESSRWRYKHRRFLIGCGIPEEVVDSDQRWCYMLLHGDDELQTGWSSDWISIEQTIDLLEFLDMEISDTTGYELVDVLRRRIAASTE